jgi:hypothetical protein
LKNKFLFLCLSVFYWNAFERVNIENY